MNKDSIHTFLKDFIDTDDSNIIPSGLTKNPHYAGKLMYDEPIAGFASAGDDFFESLKDNKAANVDLMLPKEWLPGAQTVISVFLPFKEWMRAENRGGDWPSIGWLYGRINGQVPMVRLVEALASELRANGYEAVTPLTDPRMKVSMKPAIDSRPNFTSNWSERHVAFATGLGTFGISGGIITQKGMAGRLVSIITSLYLEPTPRDYTEIFDYCILCGTCAKNCPVNAIDLALKKKDHALCDSYLTKVKAMEEPFYGCGKCQCGVPCENNRP